VLRDAEHAAIRIVGYAQVIPQQIPAIECLGDGACIAIGIAIGATDHAMPVARGGEWIRNRALLDQRDVVSQFRERPRCAQAGNTRAYDCYPHAIFPRVDVSGSESSSGKNKYAFQQREK
jgi:hypothetical protein